MFVLKPDTHDRRFVKNFRSTIIILRDSCKNVPKSAFTINTKSSKNNIIIPCVSIDNFYLEHEISAEEAILLDEPIGFSFER